MRARIRCANSESWQLTTAVAFRSSVVFVLAFVVSAGSLNAWPGGSASIGSVVLLGLLLTGVVLVFPYAGSSLGNLWTRGGLDPFGQVWARWGAYCLSAPDLATKPLQMDPCSALEKESDI